MYETALLQRSEASIAAFSCLSSLVYLSFIMHSHHSDVTPTLLAVTFVKSLLKIHIKAVCF